MVKISKSRRTSGRIALHRVKKYTNKVAQINNCRRKHKHNCIANILNEESFMAAIPNDINIDHEIHMHVYMLNELLDKEFKIINIMRS